MGRFPERWVLSGAAAACLSLAGAAVPAYGQEPNAEAASPIQITIVDNFTAEFAVPPDFLWTELKRMYLDGNKYRDLGFSIGIITPSPAVSLGGTIATRSANGQLDRREAHFTAIDEKRRFLALKAMYSNGLKAIVSYEVRPAKKGSLMQLIVHAEQAIALPGSDMPSTAAVRAETDRLVAYHYGELVDMWSLEVKRIEGLYRAGRSEPN